MDEGLASFSFERLTQSTGSAILPNNRRTQCLACLPVPQHDRLALIGDADASKLSEGYFADCGSQNPESGCPNFLRIMFHPPRLGIVLGKFAVLGSHDTLLAVKDNGAVSGGTAI